MKRLPLFIVPVCITLAASPAIAYIGPGAGLSLLGALWGLVVAIAVTVGFIILWPLRRMMRKKHAAEAADTNPQAGSESARSDNHRT